MRIVKAQHMTALPWCKCLSASDCWPHTSQCSFAQEGSCAIALNPLAYPGDVVPPPEFNEYAEPPSQTAARHAEKWANNVDPVRWSWNVRFMRGYSYACCC